MQPGWKENNMKKINFDVAYFADMYYQPHKSRRQYLIALLDHHAFMSFPIASGKLGKPDSIRPAKFAHYNLKWNGCKYE